MLPYWFLFLLPACLAASAPRLPTAAPGRLPFLWRVMFIVLVLAIGLRHEVGGDWYNYSRHLDSAGGMTFLEAVARGDPAYSALNWFSAYADLGLYFVNTACAVVFTSGLVAFCRAQPRPWVALVVALPYLVTVVAMGYTRQGAAIGFAMLGLVALSDQKILRFVVFVGLAATFHKSAVILMPLALLAASKRRSWTVLWVAVSSVLFYVLLLHDSVASLTEGYIEAQYASSGAAIRIAMNSVPALVFLLFRRRFVMSPADRSFWTWMSLGALAFIALLVISPSSTAVDRIALYWIPLQLFVLSRLPNAMGPPHGRNDVWVCLIVLYSAVVMFVWLSFADNAYAWLPYQFYPWVMLWD
jgi:hypothetical protein